MADAEQVVHVIPKRDDEEVRATLSDYKGGRYVSIRTYFRAADGEWHPTKKGITLATDFLTDLEAAVAALRAAVDGAAPPPARRTRESRYNAQRAAGGGR